MAAKLFVTLCLVFTIYIKAAFSDPPYTFTEGVCGPNDKLFADCLLNQKGSWSTVLYLPMNFTVSYPGSVITYVNVENQKPPNQQGTVTKTGGGLNMGFVSFDLESKEGHGFLFKFKICGRPAAGKTESVARNCQPAKKG